MNYYEAFIIAREHYRDKYNIDIGGKKRFQQKYKKFCLDATSPYFLVEKLLVGLYLSKKGSVVYDWLGDKKRILLVTRQGECREIVVREVFKRDVLFKRMIDVLFEALQRAYREAGENGVFLELQD